MPDVARKFPKELVGAFGASLVALAIVFAGTFRRAAHLYLHSPEEEMSYAWLVPVVSLYALWRERDALGRALAEARFSWRGVLAALPFAACGFFAVRGGNLRLEIVAFAGLCATLPWAFLGGRFARLTLFPAAYLLFLTPVTTLLDAVTIHLRYFSGAAALAALNAFGVDVVREGTVVVVRGAHPFAMDVANPCSGLRSLFALMALTAAYAHFTQRGFPRQAALFASSVPLALVGNVVRILSIGVVAGCSSPAFAMGFYHDYSGFVVFGVAIAAMVALGEWLSKGSEPENRDRRLSINGRNGEHGEGES